MRIAVTSDGNKPDSGVDDRFGRCPFFMVYDTETGGYESIDNSGNAAGGGAGIATAQSLLDQNVSAVITSNLGPNAYRVLDAGGLEVYLCPGVTIADAVDRFNKGELEQMGGSNVSGHHGLK